MTDEKVYQSLDEVTSIRLALDDGNKKNLVTFPSIVYNSTASHQFRTIQL